LVLEVCQNFQKTLEDILSSKFKGFRDLTKDIQISWRARRSIMTTFGTSNLVVSSKLLEQSLAISDQTDSERERVIKTRGESDTNSKELVESLKALENIGTEMLRQVYKKIGTMQYYKEGFEMIIKVVRDFKT
jgi:hypothetical protein